MKNIFKSILAIAAGIMAFASCADYNHELLSDQTVKLSKDAISFPIRPEVSETITVDLEGDWIATLPSECDWITVKPSYGTGKTQVQITASDNLDGVGAIAGPRKSMVNFSTTGGNSVLSVSQMGDITKLSAKTYKKVAEVVPGTSYILVVKNGSETIIGTPVPTATTYSYLLKKDVSANVEDDGSIVLPDGSYAFTFETSGNGFILRQADGEALWQTSSYNNFYTDTAPSEGYIWTVEKQEDDTFIIKSTDHNKWIQYSVKYSSFGGYDSAQEGGLLPYLYGNADKVLEVDPKSIELTDGDLEETFTITVSADRADAIPADSWITLADVASDGVKTTLTFQSAKNPDLAARTTSILVGSVDATATVTVSQPARAVTENDITDVTAKEFNDAPVGNLLYRVTGVVSNVANSKYGNFYVKDYTGEVYVYGINDFAGSGIKVNDIVTVVGKRGEYKTTIEMLETKVEKIVSVPTVSIAEFLAKDDNKNDYFCLSGKVKSISNATYGNLYITDETGELYVYGVLPGYGATGDAKKGVVGAEGIEEGDNLTVIGYKTSYNNSPQMGGGIFVSLEKAEP